jgi:hypothetical protein
MNQDFIINITEQAIEQDLNKFDRFFIARV